MLSRISRIRVQAAPTRLRHLRAYSAAPHASEPTPAEPGALDVDDAHLLPPDSTVLGSLDERNPIGEIARALHLPIGDEPHIADAGLEPPHVIQQNAPEAADDTGSSPSPVADPASVVDVSPTEAPASSNLEREIPHDSVLGLTREPTQAEYDSRRIVVEVHNGVRHMANAFAVIRYLERTYGRVSHFNLGRSADVEEDYRGAMFVTFKHPASLQRIAQAGVLSAHIPEPAHTIPFRTGSVGIDELQDVLARPVEEFGDAEQQALFQAEASKREAQLAAAEAPVVASENDAAVDASASENAVDTPPSANPTEEDEEEMVEVDGKMWPKTLADSLKEDHLLALMDFGASETQADWSHPSGKPPSSGAQDHARAVEGNLPQLFLKIQPFHSGFNMAERAFGGAQSDIVRTRPMPSQQFAIGAAFAQFRGFAPATASSARMETALQKWRPFMPATSHYQPTRVAQADVASAPASEPVLEPVPEPAPEPETKPEFRLLDTVPLDALPKPKWQMRAPPVHQRPVVAQQAQSAAAAAPAIERRPEHKDSKAKSDVQRPKKAAALEAARRAARAANQRAAEQWAAQAAATEAQATPAAEVGAVPGAQARPVPAAQARPVPAAQARPVPAAQARPVPAAQASVTPAARSAPPAKGADTPVSQPAETQESSWRKLTSRLSAFIGGGGTGSSSPRQ